MTKNHPLYCTLYNAKVGNFSGLKINTAEAHQYLFDLSLPQTLISSQIAQRLNATPQEIEQGEMMVSIMLNTDPISFEAKLDRGEIPAIPQWAALKAMIGPPNKMRIFDLIIGQDAKFKVKASPELWEKHIQLYKKNKEMSEDIS